MPTGVNNKFGDTTIRRRKQSRDRTGGRRPKYVRVRFVKVAGGWRRNAKFVWECHNNCEVPRGQRIYHLDFDTLNDTPENLVAMTPGQWLQHCQKNGRTFKEDRRKEAVRKFLKYDGYRKAMQRLAKKRIAANSRPSLFKI